MKQHANTLLDVTSGAFHGTLEDIIPCAVYQDPDLIELTLMDLPSKDAVYHHDCYQADHRFVDLVRLHPRPPWQLST